MQTILALVLALLIPSLVWGGTITRPVKSNGSTSFTNGMVPQDSDLNGDANTIYSEFNGNISNVNISASAAIAASKISPDGFTTNVRTVNSAPCYILDESDQSADLKRWALCVSGGVLQLGTYTDAQALQNNWLTVARSTGAFTLGGTGGSNTINGPTTFNQLVTFNGGNTLMPTGAVMNYMGNSAPAGWLLMNGGSNSCTGSASVNAPLCTLLVALTGTVNYKGSPAGSITVDTGSDEIIRAAHGLSVGHFVHYSSTGTLPSPLVNTTVYCVISTTTDRYKISTTCGGGAVNLTSAGSGTHSDYGNFVTPDARGRNVIGTGTGAGLTARTLGATGGEESHQLTVSELASHNHEVLVNATTAGSGGGVTGVNGSQDINKFTENMGGDVAHNVMDPFLVITYIIKL